jgi:hypothetical protein
MQWLPVERRQGLRVQAAGEHRLIVATSWPVRVHDLALGGVSFLSPYDLAIGRRVRLAGALGSQSFQAVARICWRAQPSAAAGADVELGAAFVEFLDGSETVLREFLKLPRR